MLGYALATLIGLSLGLMGGGGSILTVPILVYVLKFDAKVSIALSLAIVGLTSLIGAFTHYKKGNLNFKVALTFGPVAMLGTFLGAKLSVFLTGATQLIIFAIVMLIASYFMFQGKKDKEQNENEDVKEIDPKKKYAMIVLEGLFVGILTGIVGVGGGFMIVPALVLLSGISMKEAVGTSLLIISMKSFAGFLGYMGQFEIDWNFLLIFSAFTGVGIFAGTHLVQYISQEKLKKMFAVFLVVMGFFILYKNRAKILGQVAYINTGNHTTIVQNIKLNSEYDMNHKTLHFRNI